MTSLRRSTEGFRWVLARALACGGLLLLLAMPVAASDPPHWSGAELTIDCTTQCHTPHNALGGGLNPRTGNANLCQACHVAGGDADTLPINEVDKAVRGVGGIHHGWQVCAENSELDTQIPTDVPMSQRLFTDDGGCEGQGGYVVCSTCHNQHSASQTFGGTARISDAKPVDVSGSGTVTTSGSYTGPQGYWYWVEIVDTTPSDRFCWARVSDQSIEWCPTGSGCEGCDPDNVVLTPNLDATGSQGLETGITVTFGGGAFAVGDQWELSAAWPFLRDELNTGPDSGGNAFCINCHAAWQMTDTSTWNGGAVKSHPVGVDLVAETPLHSPPLDGDGSADDGNATNDLVLYGAGSDQVECLTCHGIHYVDSNTNTVDGPPTSP